MNFSFFPLGLCISIQMTILLLSQLCIKIKNHFIGTKELRNNLWH